MKNVILTFGFLFIIFPIWGQWSYIQTDSLLIELPVINQGAIKNARECYVDYKREKKRYSPDDLLGYGLDNGTVYVSRIIQLGDSTLKVFLEVLESGDRSLYCYRTKSGKCLFISDGGTLLSEVSKEIYREQLKEWSYTDYPELKKEINFVGYNERSLKKFVNKYNKKDLSPFPFPKIGLMVGNEMAKLNPFHKVLKETDLIRYDYESNFMVGAFLDYPILLSDFSAHLEIYYSSHSYKYKGSNENESLELKVTAPDVKVPLLFRYTSPFRKLRPFVNIGGVYAYNFKPSISYGYFIGDVSGSRPGISIHHFGYSAGCGLEYKLNYKNSLFFDFRYSNLYGISPGNGINYSLMQMSLGFNFR